MWRQYLRFRNKHDMADTTAAVVPMQKGEGSFKNGVKYPGCQQSHSESGVPSPRLLFPVKQPLLNRRYTKSSIFL